MEAAIANGVKEPGEFVLTVKDMVTIRRLMKISGDHLQQLTPVLRTYCCTYYVMRQENTPLETIIAMILCRNGNDRLLQNVEDFHQYKEFIA